MLLCDAKLMLGVLVVATWFCIACWNSRLQTQERRKIKKTQYSNLHHVGVESCSNLYASSAHRSTPFELSELSMASKPRSMFCDCDEPVITGVTSLGAPAALAAPWLCLVIIVGYTVVRLAPNKSPGLMDCLEHSSVGETTLPHRRSTTSATQLSLRPSTLLSS